MKLDSETICSHSTLAPRPDSQFFHYDDSTVETVWKMKNEVMGEDKRRTVSDGDIKKFDGDTNVLLIPEKCEEIKKIPQLRDLLVEEKSINDVRETEPFKSSSVKLSEKETKLSTDKKSSELELMVCFKETEDGDYHVVKDICVDDGLPSHDKHSIENDEIEKKGNLSTMHSILEADKAASKESVDIELPITNGTNPFIECHGKLDVPSNYCSKSLTGFDMENNEEAILVGGAESNIFSPTNPFLDSNRYTNFAEKFSSESSSENGDEMLKENIHSEEPIVYGTNPFLGCVSKADDDKKYCSESSVEGIEEDFDKIVNLVSDEKATHETLVTLQNLDAYISPQPSNSDKHEEKQQSDQDIRTEADSADTTVPSVVEETSECNHEEGPLSSQMDTESITCDSSAPIPETSSKEGDSKNSDYQQSVKTLTMPIIEEETLDGLRVSSRSFSNHDYGEMSFSAAGPMSGRIAYSGPIPYSGSISIRSDSSTTSTRSFAFPVLHSEWNSSPVKMAKADRRSFRKQRGWLPSLLCCRF